MKLLHKTLQELFIRNCPLIRSEPLLWIGGAAGPYKQVYCLVSISLSFELKKIIIFSMKSLKSLRSLDLSLCPITDMGFMAIPPGTASHFPSFAYLICNRFVACSKLQFLNLQECTELTDDSIIVLAKHCRALQLLNISGCSLVSDKAASALGSGCGALVSLNLSRCSKISDKGIRAIATG